MLAAGYGCRLTLVIHDNHLAVVFSALNPPDLDRGFLCRHKLDRVLCGRCRAAKVDALYGFITVSPFLFATGFYLGFRAPDKREEIVGPGFLGIAV